jgi:hypothetical protein
MLAVRILYSKKRSDLSSHCGADIVLTLMLSACVFKIGCTTVSKVAYVEERACRRYHDTSKHLDHSHLLLEGFYSPDVSAIFS